MDNMLVPAGLSAKEGILNINQGRKRARYIRPEGGRLTTLLPADPFSIAYYTAKGFRLPTEVEEVADTIKCPLCDFRAQSAFGLAGHLRKHTNSESKTRKSKKEE